MVKDVVTIRGTYLENEATFSKPKLEWVEASTSTVNPDGREFIVDSSASMHMMSTTDLPPEALALGLRRMDRSAHPRGGNSSRERFGHVRHGPTS